MAPLVQELTQTITQATTTYVTAFILGGNQAWPTVNYVTQTLTYPSTTIVEVNIASTPASSRSASPSAHGGLTGSAKGAIAGSILGAVLALLLCCFCCRGRPSYYPPSSPSTGTRRSSPKGSLNEPLFPEIYPTPYLGGSSFLSNPFMGKNGELKEPVGEPNQSPLGFPASWSKQPHKGILKNPDGANQPGSRNVLAGSSVPEKTSQPSTGTAAPKNDSAPSETKPSADLDQPKKPKKSKSNPPSLPDKPQPGSSKTSQPSTGTAAPKNDNVTSEIKLSADPDHPKKSKSSPPSGPDKPQTGSSKTSQPSTITAAPKIGSAPSETKPSADPDHPKKSKSSLPSGPDKPQTGSSKTSQPSMITTAPKIDSAPSETKPSAVPNQPKKPKKPKSSSPSLPDKPQPASSKAPSEAPREHNPPLSRIFVQPRGAPYPDPPPDPPPAPPAKKHPSPPPTPPSPQLIEFRTPRTHDISSVYKRTVGYTDSTMIAREGPSKPVIFKRKLERRTIWGGWPGSGAVTRPVTRRSKSKKRGDKSKE